MNREILIIKEQIQLYPLNLSGLTVITECASGYYAFNTLVPLMAGAKKVIAVGGDSVYASYSHCRDNLMDILTKNNLNTEHITICDKLEKEHLEEADIITNTGFVRPITASMMKCMKKSAVIPLMWETWEFRDSDLDLPAARENEILVLGTHEAYPKLAMYPYIGMLALSLLFRLELEVYKNRVILIGGGIPGTAIADTFQKNGVFYHWFVDTPQKKEQLPYHQISQYKEIFSHADAIIFIEHEIDKDIFCVENDFTFQQLARLNPDIKMGVISGKLDIPALKESGLRFYPPTIKPFGFMSFQPYHLGPRPVLELFSAGLKVGELMARCRLKGMGIAETIQYCLTHSPAMDFGNGGYMEK